MTITNEVREIENHLKSQAVSKADKLKWISLTQAMLAHDESKRREFAIITIAKRRMIRA